MTSSRFWAEAESKEFGSNFTERVEYKLESSFHTNFNFAKSLLQRNQKEWKLFKSHLLKATPKTF